MSDRFSVMSEYSRMCSPEQTRKDCDTRPPHPASATTHITTTHVTRITYTQATPREHASAAKHTCVPCVRHTPHLRSTTREASAVCHTGTVRAHRTRLSSSSWMPQHIMFSAKDVGVHVIRVVCGRAKQPNLGLDVISI